MTLANQMFLRFYLVIVLSVIFIGWSVDTIWQSFYSFEQEDYHHEEVLNLASKLLVKNNAAQSTNPISSTSNIDDVNLLTQLDAINQSLAQPLELVDIEQIKADSLLQALQRGEVITLQNASGEYTAYQNIPGSRLVLAIHIPTAIQMTWLKIPLLIIFYLTIALIVYWWTRPLIRDLKTLEDAATNFTDAKWETQIQLPDSSPIRHLASAYNELLNKIKYLLNDQQEMSHAISHELRTPLARIKFSLEMAHNSNQIESIKQQLSSIAEDVIEIQLLVDELLAYASLEKSSTSAKIEKGDLKGLIVSLTEKLQRNAPDKSLKMASFDSALPVYCDNYLIERALQNLIINALNHGKSQVLVSFEQQNSINRLLVDDDGEGISQTDRDRVFDSFVRLENQPHSKRRGFGLGLAIVKRIALLHQGNVSVETSPLGGARFILQWPNRVNLKHS